MLYFPSFELSARNGCKAWSARLCGKEVQANLVVESVIGGALWSRELRRPREEWYKSPIAGRPDEQYYAWPSGRKTLRIVDAQFDREDDAQTRAKVGGANDTPCVSILQGWTAGDGYVHWFFSNYIPIFSAVSTPQACFMQEGYGALSGCPHVAGGSVCKAAFESRLLLSWKGGGGWS